MLAAGDGQAALDDRGGEQPDLVLLDIGLPVLNGLEVCRAIREFSTVPIIMLTARRPPRPTRWRASTRAPTTTSPSPSGRRSCWRGCARRCGARATRSRRPTSRSFQHGELTIDFARHAVTPRWRAGLTLTPTEYKLLVQLPAAPDGCWCPRSC